MAREKRLPFEVSLDPFYSYSNMRAVSESIEQMNEQAALFIDGIVGELESHHKRMEDQIKNKKENLQKYENLLNELKNAKQVLQEADTASIFLQ